MKNVFIQTTKMDTQTIYHENGGVTITPAVYELGKHQIVAGGKMSVVQKGKMISNDDGSSKFLPYVGGGGSRYSRIFKTRHGTVKQSKANIIFSINMPKRYGKKLINSILHEELRQIEAYAKSQRSVGKDEEWEACL